MVTIEDNTATLQFIYIYVNWVTFHHGMVGPYVVGGGDILQIRRAPLLQGLCSVELVREIVICLTLVKS
jgi:hypothetical protein